MAKQKPKLVVDRYKFDYDLGMKIARAKYREFARFKDGMYISEAAEEMVKKDWNDVSDITVTEALGLRNLEARRIAFRYIGVENVFKALEPELVDEQVVEKATKVNEKGELESFNDKYQLYKVKGEVLLKDSENANISNRTVRDFYILRCFCTSTQREYLIYIQDIWTADRWGRTSSNKDRKPDAIEAVAWTIQVDVATKDIDYIIRQGDCIMVKTKNEKYEKSTSRHLTKEEYLDKVKMES